MWPSSCHKVNLSGCKDARQSLVLRTCMYPSEFLLQHRDFWIYSECWSKYTLLVRSRPYLISYRCTPPISQDIHPIIQSFSHPIIQLIIHPSKFPSTSNDSTLFLKVGIAMHWYTFNVSKYKVGNYICTLCPRGLVHVCTCIRCIKMDMTSWTCSTPFQCKQIKSKDQDFVPFVYGLFAAK